MSHKVIVHKKQQMKENTLFCGVAIHAQFNATVGENGGPYDFYDYATGYLGAAKGLLDMAQEWPDAERPWLQIDTMIYPACLTFRHGVELLIKYLIADLAEKLNSDEKYERGHSLKLNWSIARRLVKQAGIKLGDDDLDIMETVVNSMEEIDPTGEVFRYPENFKNEKALKGWAHINVIRVASYRDMVHEIADKWHGQIHDMPKAEKTD